MKHSERHTYTFDYDKNLIDFYLLQSELILFKEHYPNAIVKGDVMGRVSISYENISNVRNVAECAALAFRDRMRNFTCWVEV